MKFLGFSVNPTYLILGLLACAQAQESPECFEHGECTESLLLDFFHEVGSAQVCLERCQQDSDCEYFTFYEEDHSCLTFVNCVTFSTDSCYNCYSGNRACEDLVCWEEGLCNGVLVGETYNLDSKECLDECRLNEGCLWFTHDSDGDICLMFQDCQTIDASCETCLSSQRQCSPLVEPTNPDYTKLIVIGGAYFDEPINSVEAIDLENPSSACSTIDDYPYADASMTVGVIDGLIKSCGGDIGTDDCFDYDPTTNSWTPSVNMIFSRSNPRSSFIDGLWLVSGGLSSSGTTTEMWTGSGFEEGPTLPTDMYAHCQLTVNNTHVFFSDTYYTGNSYLLDWYQEIWTTLPRMSMFTEYPSCGLINNPENGAEVIIVEDGASEIFNFNTLTWRDGPSVESFDNAGFTQLTDTFVVVGGEDSSNDPIDTIYQFDHINYEWILLPQRLQTARQETPGVVAVPDGFVTCN